MRDYGWRVFQKKKSCGIRLKAEDLTTGLNEEPICDEGYHIHERFKLVGDTFEA